MKKVLIVGLLFLLSCARQSYRGSIVDQKSDWIDFRWESIQSNGRTFDKAAIMVPFRIEGIPHQFESQFDLGATRTMVYGNSFQPYFEKYKSLLSYSDTSASSIWIQNKKLPFFNNVNVYLDTNPFTVQRLAFFDNYGEKFTNDSLNTTSVKHIGTVGVDLFQNKIVVIDYPNQKMKALDSLTSADEKRFDFVNCRIENGRIKIPMQIDGKEYWLLFDTGASLFPLTTSNEYYQLFSDRSNQDTIQVSSWGEKYFVYGSPITVEVKLGNTLLPQKNVYDFSNYKDFFEQENIMGLTGNAYFLNHTIAIDFKNKRFGVLKAK